MLGFDVHRPLQWAARLSVIVAVGALVPSAGHAQGFPGGYGGYGYPGGPRVYGDAPGYRYGEYGPGFGRVVGAYPPAYYTPRPYLAGPPVAYLPPPVYVGPPRVSYVVQGRAIPIRPIGHQCITPPPGPADACQPRPRGL